MVKCVVIYHILNAAHCQESVSYTGCFGSGVTM
jgi:hypothetical protein